MNTTQEKEVSDFLELHCINGPKAIFALTPSSLAISVYRQQIRSLNLAYCIKKNWKEIKPNLDSVDTPGRIAVIGGGFAGITVAAGLLKLGFEIHLFEQRTQLCHLQSGCETRWLHPRIYEWPAMDSDLADARLPLLTWSASSAGDVARTVVQNFEKLCTEEFQERCILYMRAHARIQDGKVVWNNAEQPSIHYANWLGRCGDQPFDTIILATGFGIEQSLSENSFPYWRNDSNGQPSPVSRSERKSLVLISGTGDGGLTDLIRLTLQNVKQDRLIQELFGGKTRLIRSLDSIRASRDDQTVGDQEISLIDAFREIEKENPEEILDLKKCINKRLREDVQVILNGRDISFSMILTMKSKSFLNVFLAYMLYELKAFSYVGGDCKPDGKRSVIIENAHSGLDDQAGIGHRIEFDIGIFRFGTKREDSLLSAGLSTNDIRSLFLKQKDISRRLENRLWEPGWWTACSDTAHPSTHSWIEKYSSFEKAISTTFVSGLKESLSQIEDMIGSLFRLTLHRTLRYKAPNGDILHCYQQICPYFGTDPERLNGNPGRVFIISEPAKSGLVGLSIRSCNITCAQFPRESLDWERWTRLWNYLLPRSTDEVGNTRFRSMDPKKVTTVIAYPIRSKVFDSRETVQYILYLDIDSSKAESRPGIPSLLRVLDQHIKGFCNGITKLNTDGRFAADFSCNDSRGTLNEANRAVGDRNAIEKEFIEFREMIQFFRREDAEIHVSSIHGLNLNPYDLDL